MMPWFFRYSMRMVGILLMLLFVEYITFVFYRESGINRFFWLPLSVGFVALAGFDTVSRLPLIWGAFVGGLLFGLTSVISWEIGSFVLMGRFEFPAEAEPLLVLLTFALTSIIGAIIGGMAGLAARSRRRQRQRRSSIKKLAYSAFDEQHDEQSDPPARPMMSSAERR
ncbi:MAG: hypothetical protein IT355_11535 [Gemmatimonadaceae bacterium]|nr:hypothetical protein [Gemmatimonadaceae bacterium]